MNRSGRDDDPDAEFLAGLRFLGREYAAALRPTALDFDADPGLAPRLLVQRLPWRQLMGLPPAYNPDPLRVRGRPAYLDSCRQQVVMFEELARADAAAVLALPGPSMSGFVVAELGDDVQRERYCQLLAEEPTWTFFAMTEPAHGSDPGGMDTALRPGDAGALVLNGVKRFIGNGARAGPAWCSPGGAPGRSASWRSCSTRPGPASPACPWRPSGCARCSSARSGCGTCRSHRKTCSASRNRPPGRACGPRRAPSTATARWSPASPWGWPRPPTTTCWTTAGSCAAPSGTCWPPSTAGWHGVRALIAAAAAAADLSPGDGALASAAKIRAVRLAQEITTTALPLLGPGARWEHPLLDKLARDARGFEFMEGTSGIQRSVLAQGYLQGRLADVVPA